MPAHPLRALPEVEVRDEQPRRAAVLRVERLVVVLVRDPRLAVADVLEREVRRVAAVAEREDVLGARVDAVEQRVERDARPRRVELRPLRHAVDVDGDPLARQRRELAPTSRTSARRPRRGSRSSTRRAAGGASARPRGPGSRASRTGPAAPAPPRPRRGDGRGTRARSAGITHQVRRAGHDGLADDAGDDVRLRQHQEVRGAFDLRHLRAGALVGEAVQLGSDRLVCGAEHAPRTASSRQAAAAAGSSNAVAESGR